MRGKQRTRDFFAILSDVAETDVEIPRGVEVSALVNDSCRKIIFFASTSILSTIYGPEVLT